MIEFLSYLIVVGCVIAAFFWGRYVGRRDERARWDKSIQFNTFWRN